MCLEPEPANANKTTACLADFAAGGTNNSCVFFCFNSEYRSQKLLGASSVVLSSKEYSLATNFANESIVGWSNSTVGSNSVPRRSVSKVVSSVAASESIPADISGVSLAMDVPCVSSTAFEMTSEAAWAVRPGYFGALLLESDSDEIAMLLENDSDEEVKQR